MFCCIYLARRLAPRPWLLVLGGVLCLAEMWIAGLYYHGYQILQGRHGWFPSELAFLIHYVLFGVAAAVFLSAALGPWLGPRLLRAFDRTAELSREETRALVGLRLGPHLPARDPRAIHDPEGRRRQRR